MIELTSCLQTQTLDMSLETHVCFKISFTSADRQLILGDAGQDYEG